MHGLAEEGVDAGQVAGAGALEPGEDVKADGDRGSEDEERFLRAQNARRGGGLSSQTDHFTGSEMEGKTVGLLRSK
jgi:hypothetical protein